MTRFCSACESVRPKFGRCAEASHAVGGSDADALPSDSTSGVNLAANNCAVSLSVSVKIRYRTNPSVPGHGTSSDGGWLLREAALSVAVQPALRAT